MCAAFEEFMPLNREMATELCRSGRFPTCERFRVAHPGWRPVARSRRVGVEPNSRWILNSLAWVVGIPTAITMLIVLAIWITENVWVPTQTAMPGLIF